MGGFRKQQILERNEYDKDKSKSCRKRKERKKGKIEEGTNLRGLGMNKQRKKKEKKERNYDRKKKSCEIELIKERMKERLCIHKRERMIGGLRKEQIEEERRKNKGRNSDLGKNSC